METKHITLTVFADTEVLDRKIQNIKEIQREIDICVIDLLEAVEDLQNTEIPVRLGDIRKK